MYHAEEKKGIAYYLKTHWTWGAFLLILFLLLKANWGIYQSYQSSKEILAKLTEKEQTLLLREKTLEEKMRFYKTEKGVESQIRTVYGMTKEGEEVYIVKGDSVGNGGEDVSHEKQGIIRRIYNYFFSTNK
jgi:cell division protein FtsB